MTGSYGKRWAVRSRIFPVQGWKHVYTRFDWSAISVTIATDYQQPRDNKQTVHGDTSSDLQRQRLYRI